MPTSGVKRKMCESICESSSSASRKSEDYSEDSMAGLEMSAEQVRATLSLWSSEEKTHFFRLLKAKLGNSNGSFRADIAAQGSNWNDFMNELNVDRPIPRTWGEVKEMFKAMQNLIHFNNMEWDGVSASKLRVLFRNPTLPIMRRARVAPILPNHCRAGSASTSSSARRRARESYCQDVRCDHGEARLPHDTREALKTIALFMSSDQITSAVGRDAVTKISEAPCMATCLLDLDTNDARINFVKSFSQH